MRTRVYVLLMSILSLGGCKGYLDVQPQGKVIPKTDEEFASIMHNRINDIEGGGDEYVIGNMDAILKYEAFADNLDANVATGNIPAYCGDKINSRQTDWRMTFEIIRDCNIVIENMEGRTSDVAKGTLAAAYAMKGICYYNLMRDFCQAWEAGRENDLQGIPIVRKFDISDMTTRGTLRETADYAEEMLQASLDQHNSDKAFFFTEYVVKAYIAKVRFWREDWSGTISICSDIMANSGISLTPIEGYEDMIQSANEPKGEVLVRSHINNASELDWYFTSVRQYLRSRPASAKLVRLFGDEPEKDVRYAISFDNKRFNLKAPECKVRMSEIVLMLAEAYYHAGEEDKAIGLVNELRRNRITDVTDLTAETLPAVRSDETITEDATGKPVTPLLQAIFDERRKELYMEADRWFELKRNGSPEWWIINNGLKYTTRQYMYTAPIYKGDIALNPDMIQNPGYETAVK